MRAETVCNAYLEGPERLTIEDVAMLRALGWNDPTSGPGITPHDDPDGAPNHFLEWAPPVDHAEIAALAVRTFSRSTRSPTPAGSRTGRSTLSVAS